jgi:hypothetical protein
VRARDDRRRQDLRSEKDRAPPHAPLIARWYGLRTRSPSRLSTSDDALARTSPAVTITISSAISFHSLAGSADASREATTASIINFPTQSVATGTAARIRRRTAIAAVYPGCVSQTSLINGGMYRSAANRS